MNLVVHGRSVKCRQCTSEGFVRLKANDQGNSFKRDELGYACSNCGNKQLFVGDIIGDVVEVGT